MEKIGNALGYPFDPSELALATSTGDDDAQASPAPANKDDANKDEGEEQLDVHAAASAGICTIFVVLQQLLMHPHIVWHVS